MRHKDADGVRLQLSKDDIGGDGGEHPFVRELIEKSVAERAAATNATVAAVALHAPADAAVIHSVPAAVESSCESLGSKGKHAAAADALPEDVVSFEQRRKEILRLTREAEERKKR